MRYRRILSRQSLHVKAERLLIILTSYISRTLFTIPVLLAIYCCFLNVVLVSKKEGLMQGVTAAQLVIENGVLTSILNKSETLMSILLELCM